MAVLIIAIVVILVSRCIFFLFFNMKRELKLYLFLIIRMFLICISLFSLFFSLMGVTIIVIIIIIVITGSVFSLSETLSLLYFPLRVLTTNYFKR